MTKPVQVFYNRVDFPMEEQLIHDFRQPIVKDPGVHILQVKHHNQTLGNVVIWANHPEALGSWNTALSPDYPATLRQDLSDAKLGTTVFMVGAIGGLLSPGTETPIPDLNGKMIKTTGKDRAVAVGAHLARRVQTALAKNELAPLAVDRIWSQTQTLQIPLANARFKNALEQNIIRGHSVIDGKIKSRVSLIELGDLLLIGIPGEIFPEMIWSGIPQISTYRLS